MDDAFDEVTDDMGLIAEEMVETGAEPEVLLTTETGIAVKWMYLTSCLTVVEWTMQLRWNQSKAPLH